MDGAFASGTTWAKAGIAALTKTTARSVFRYITILHWIQCIDGFNQHRIHRILFSAEIPFNWIACLPPSWAEPRSWEIRAPVDGQGPRAVEIGRASCRERV